MHRAEFSRIESAPPMFHQPHRRKEQSTADRERVRIPKGAHTGFSLVRQGQGPCTPALARYGELPALQTSRQWYGVPLTRFSGEASAGR